MLCKLLSLCVAIRNLSFDLHLSVCQPASNLLHEDKVKHVTFKPEIYKYNIKQEGIRN